MNSGCLPRIIAIIVAILAMLALYWWFFLREPPPVIAARPDDAGNYSFVRQAVPLIQGRKVRGHDEIRVLADLIAETDRATLVRLITRRNALYAGEYVEHWSDLIVDWLKINRETAKAQTSCFGAPRMSAADSELARYVRDNAPFVSPGHQGYSIGGTPVDFNMSDVLRSSVVLDNLAPVYLAYLFPLVNKPITGNEIIEQNRRADLGAAFVDVYTRRQMTCLGCHNSTSSASGPQTYWNRHYPVYGNFEKAIYGFSTGRDSREVEALLRHGGFVNGSTRPWGMEDCGSYDSPSEVVDDTLTHPDSGAFLEAYFVQPIGRRGSVWDLEASLRRGMITLQTSGLERGPDGDVADACDFCESSCVDGVEVEDPAQAMREAQVQTIVNQRCVSCHTGQHDSWAGAAWKDAWIVNNLIVPGDSGSSYVVTRIEAPTMPPSWATGTAPDGTPLSDPLSAGQITTIRDWIDGLVGSGGDCEMCPTLDCEENLVAGDAAFAFLVASNIVSNTWSEIFGPKLTIANYFPRSSGQGAALWNLAESEFVPSQWSLQQIITRMLTSEYFNRMPPETSTGTYAYELALAFDPWVEGDPRYPPRALPGWDPSSGSRPDRDPAFTTDDDANRALLYNAMTEGIHRYKPRSLLHSVHRALGWSAAPRFSNGSSYPSDQLRKAIGQFWRDAEPGFNEVDFQGLLNWESVHGRCANPGAGDDWIDELVEAVRAHNAANPSSPVTLRDVAVIMKDWILGYGRIQEDAAENPVGTTASEAELLTALLGGWNDAAATASDAERNALEARMRDYCGVLLQTPQFMLAGIAPTDLGEKPRLRVCPDDGEPCSYRQICESFQSAFRLPEVLVCDDDSLEVTRLALPPWPCLSGHCGWIDIPIEMDCLRDPLACPKLPECDPRCATIDCCGGPLPPLERPGYILDSIDGSRVLEVRGVRIRPAAGDEFVELAPGRVLAKGDMLALPAGSRLEIETRDGRRGTPAKGMPARRDERAWLIVVADPDPPVARAHFETPAIRQTLPRAFQARALEMPWSRYGEAGPPRLLGQEELRDEARIRYRGSSNRRPEADMGGR